MREHPSESTDLELHTALCAERYLALETRLDGVEQRLDRIESEITEVHQAVRKLAEHHASRWDSLQIGVIGVLMATIGGLLGLTI